MAIFVFFLYTNTDGCAQIVKLTVSATVNNAYKLTLAVKGFEKNHVLIKALESMGFVSVYLYDPYCVLIISYF